MSSINVNAREVAAKIVFYGPGLSGKTTTLKRIFESVRPQHRGDMMSLATEGDRTLFFDFLPVKVERVGDCAVRLALYTVPGQVFYNATRKLVLQGADGVVFVADSQPDAMDSNRESLMNLEENLADQGIRLERFPLVVQYNKRDLGNALSVEQLRRELNPRTVPDFETVAQSGKGVLDVLKAITRLVIKDLRAKRIVPPPRSQAPASTVPQLNDPSAGIEDQLRQHLHEGGEPEPDEYERTPTPFRSPVATPVPPAIPHVQAVPSHPAHTAHAAPAHGAAQAAAAKAQPAAPAQPKPAIGRGGGPAGVLSPPQLLDYARAVDTAYQAGDFAVCVRACHEAVRRALALTGEASLPAQAYFLKVDGGDLLRLQGLLNKAPLQQEDAAFALYVVLQVFTRAGTAGVGR